MEHLYSIKADLEKMADKLKTATDAAFIEIDAIQKQIDRMMGKSQFDDLMAIYNAIPTGGISVSDLNKTCSAFRNMSVVGKRVAISDLENEGKIETFRVKSTATAKRSATMIYRIGKPKPKPETYDGDY